jgi:hypothetical protein
MFLNAAMATIAGTGFALGLVPHAAEHPLLARRVAAGELAGACVFAFVARRLHREPSLVALSIAFVFLNLVDSLYEFAVSRNPSDLPPAFVEGIFFMIYCVFYWTELRPRRGTSPA